MIPQPKSFVGLQNIWDTCRVPTDNRDLMLKILHKDNQRLEQKLAEYESQIATLQDTVTQCGDYIIRVDTQLTALRDANDSHAYVMVLIDGDCMPFDDELVRQGAKGGKKAAHTLQQSLDKIKPMLDGPTHHVQVCARVYANVKGLGATYHRLGILPSADNFRDFIRGFNMDNQMCDFVDAGNGKECTDEKIKANFKFHMNNVHCRKILFGGTADNGYARILDPCTQNSIDKDRIVLLEGPAPAHEIFQIKHHFRTLLLEGVFRNEKLSTTTKSRSSTPSSMVSGGYAAALKKPSPVPSPTPSSASRASSSNIKRDRKGRRIDPGDPILHGPEFGEMKALMARQLCHSSYLLGVCEPSVSFEKCRYEHDDQLSKWQMKILGSVARHVPCDNGTACDHEDCIRGHSCPYLSCSKTGCRFPADMH